MTLKIYNQYIVATDAQHIGVIWMIDFGKDHKLSIYFIIGVVLFILLMKVFSTEKKLPNENFTCARCNKREKFSHRTIESWRKGYKKLYCQECFKLWMEKNPQHKRSYQQKSGCLGMLILHIVIPISVLILITNKISS